MEMEELTMKIKGITILRLYGKINYDLNFNDDITFLYGDNGCGKTTILNIITYIITGRIYELFQYDFEKIVLKYSSSNTNKTDIIAVTQLDEDILKVELGKESQIIEHRRFEYIDRTLGEREDIERFYLGEYSLLDKIKSTFNYIYLPLNRSGNIVNDFSTNTRSRRMAQSRMATHSSKYDNSFDFTLADVEALVKSSYSKMNFLLNRINEQFSDDILKSFLDVENMSNYGQIIAYMNSLNEDEIHQIQSDYTAVLETIGKWDSETETKINSFFKSLGDDIRRVKGLPTEGVPVELVFKLSELTKITNIISKAEKTEQRKKRFKQPIEMFINTVNLFISSNERRKEITVDSDGIFLKSANQKIDIYHLSSGEKQIVTFFAYLIFGLETTSQSIFIVDEPELSLHLNWQRKFVDAIMSINQNMQLIFATHAPEMIGKHRDKAIKLIPKL